MNGEVKRVISYPTCKQVVKWRRTKGKFLPFCSQKCSLIDLGSGASEKTVVQGGTINDGGRDPKDVI